MKALQKTLIIVILTVMILPLLQERFHFFKSKPLIGISTSYTNPNFTTIGFFNITYQDSLTNYLNENIGFRPDLIRVLNQITYSLFNESKSSGVIIGKNNQFFIDSYINNYTGKVFIGKAQVRENVRKIKSVQEFLKKEKNIDLIIVFAPGKASFYPEYIPNNLKAIKYPYNHYTEYVSEFHKSRINFLDLNKYFQNIKNSSPYPLYPKYGTHWSSYGAALGADTILKYIEKLRGINLTDINFNQIVMSDSMRDSDYDIGVLLNQLIEPKPEPMPYVTYHYLSDSTTIKPNVLAIGDSYWWTFVSAGIPSKVFKEDVYWNYGNAVYINNAKQKKFVRELDLKKEIEKREVIIIMATEATFNLFPYEFIDNAYINYTASKEERIEYWYKTIKTIPEWYEQIKTDAKRKKRKTDDVLRENAIWWVEQGH